MDLSSIESEICYLWLVNNTLPASDPTSLTWFVGCNFLWQQYAVAMDAEKFETLSYAKFEGVLKVFYGKKVERKNFRHTHCVSRGYETNARGQRKERLVDEVRNTMIFTGIRYLKDGDPKFGV